MLNPRNCYFVFFGVKNNERFNLICNDITLKHSSHKKFLGVTIDNKFSFDEHINNICKTANKKLNALNRVNQEKISSSFIISRFSYSPLIWMFCSKNLLEI